MEQENACKAEKKPKRISLKKVFDFLTAKDGIIATVILGLSFLYGLCMATPLSGLIFADVAFKQPLLTMSPLFDRFLVCALIGVFISLFYGFFRNNVRRIYYVSNIIFGGIFSAYTFFIGCYILILDLFYHDQFLWLFHTYAYTDPSTGAMSAVAEADLTEEMKAASTPTIIDYLDDPDRARIRGTNIPKNTPVFWIGYVLAVLVMAFALISLAQLIVKIITGQKLRKEIFQGEESVKNENGKEAI
jgi:hypothetical protein